MGVFIDPNHLDFLFTVKTGLVKQYYVSLYVIEHKQ